MMADDFGDFNYDEEEEYGYDDAGVADGTTDDIDQVPDDGGEDGASRNNGPFYKAAGLLILIFLLSLLCGGISYATRGGGDETADSGTNSGQSEEIAAIETQNAVVAVTNAAVTQTIIAMETEAATTPTPAIPPTNTPFVEPTKTSVPTATPLFQETTPNPDEDGGDNADGGASTADTGTSIGDGVSTPTPIPGLGSGSGNSGSGTLPETGIGAWVAALAALGLIGLFMGARKMRHA
jgi:hypothetical protein